MDKLSKAGLELNNHYAFKFCSPSRCSLQSGRNPIHVNVMNLDPTNYNPSDPVSGFAAVPRNMTTIAAVMKRGGYATHFSGKWDVGMVSKGVSMCQRIRALSLARSLSRSLALSLSRSLPANTYDRNNSNTPQPFSSNNIDSFCIFRLHLRTPHVVEGTMRRCTTSTMPTITGPMKLDLARLQPTNRSMWELLIFGKGRWGVGKDLHTRCKSHAIHCNRTLEDTALQPLQFISAI